MGDVPSFPALTAADVTALVVGVSLLGSGGGGDAMTFARVLRHRLGPGTLRLHSPSELAGEVVVPVGVVGATSVFVEKLPGGHELTGAVRAVCRWTGVDATAVMALEAGGLNGVAGLVAALELDVPFLDADLMGRALPRLDQLTWSAQGTPVPAALCEPGGQVVVVDGASPAALERTARAFLAQSGGWAAIALRPVPVPVATRDAVTGSLARALRLGHGHAGLPERAAAEAVAAALGGDVLGVGRVRQIARLHHPLPTGSSIHVDSSDTGHVLRIEAQNEYLLAFVDGRAVASTPDLVCVLDRRTCLPIAVDLLRTGDEVMVLVLPGPTWWRTPRRLRHVDPTAFGLDHEPVIRSWTS